MWVISEYLGNKEVSGRGLFWWTRIIQKFDLRDRVWMGERCQISPENSQKFYLAIKASHLPVGSEGKNANLPVRTAGSLGQNLKPVSSRLEVECDPLEIFGCSTDVYLIWWQQSFSSYIIRTKSSSAHISSIKPHFISSNLDCIKITDINFQRLYISQYTIWGAINPYPTAFPYGNGMVLHFYQQQESSTTKTVHKVINRGLKAYV